MIVCDCVCVCYLGVCKCCGWRPPERLRGPGSQECAQPKPAPRSVTYKVLLYHKPLLTSIAPPPSMHANLQVIGIISIFAWVFGLMLLLFGGLKAVGLLRISAEEEQAGLDVSKHGGSAYNYDHGLGKPEKAQVCVVSNRCLLMRACVCARVCAGLQGTCVGFVCGSACVQGKTYARALDVKEGYM